MAARIGKIGENFFSWRKFSVYSVLMNWKLSVDLFNELCVINQQGWLLCIKSKKEMIEYVVKYPPTYPKFVFKLSHFILEYMQVL